LSERETSGEVGIAVGPIFIGISVGIVVASGCALAGVLHPAITNNPIRAKANRSTLCLMLILYLLPQIAAENANMFKNIICLNNYRLPNIIKSHPIIGA
jgi:hypothetical protein